MIKSSAPRSIDKDKNYYVKMKECLYPAIAPYSDKKKLGLFKRYFYVLSGAFYRIKVKNSYNFKAIIINMEF